jgi:hypothetical protein
MFRRIGSHKVRVGLKANGIAFGHEIPDIFELGLRAIAT